MLVKVSCDDLFDLFPTYPFFLHCFCLSLPSAYVVKLICISVFTHISIHTIPLRSTRLYGPVRVCVRACANMCSFQFFLGVFFGQGSRPRMWASTPWAICRTDRLSTIDYRHPHQPLNGFLRFFRPFRWYASDGATRPGRSPPRR